MSLIAAKKAMYMALEATYATEAAIAGTDVLDTEELRIVAIDGPVVQRNRDRPNLGGTPRIQTGEFVSFSFNIPLAGAGAADTVPKYAELLELAAFDVAEVVATTHVEMDLIPSTATVKSGTFFFEHDGQQHKILGARCSTQWQLSPGGRPMIQVSGQGLFVSPTSVAGLTPDYTGWNDELPINDANVPTFTLHGETVVMSSFSVNQNGQLNYRNVVNGEEVVLSDWDFTGQVTFDAPAISAKDWFAVSKAGTRSTLQMVIGAAAGSIVQIDGAKVQMRLSGDTYAPSPEGISTLTADLFFTNETEQKDFVLTTK